MSFIQFMMFCTKNDFNVLLTVSNRIVGRGRGGLEPRTRHETENSLESPTFPTVRGEPGHIWTQCLTDSKAHKTSAISYMTKCFMRLEINLIHHENGLHTIIRKFMDNYKRNY